MSNMTWQQEQDAILEAAGHFPATFGLRGFPGETFRVSLAASHFAFGDVVIYTQTLCNDGVWRDFAKGSEAELWRQIITAPAKVAQ